MASSLLRELKDIQAMLVPAAGSPRIGAVAAAGPPLYSTASSSEDEATALALPPPPSSPSKRTRELERQAMVLRQQVAEANDRCRVLDEAVQAARHDGSLAVSKLHAQLVAKAEETRQLADLVFRLQGEADDLRAQLAASATAMRAAEASTTQLQEAAAEWRRHGEEGLEVAAQERMRCAALQAEVERLREELGVVRGEGAEQRRQRKAAEAEVARLMADGSGPTLVAELRSRCAQEKAWRKAVCRYLEGEMHAKSELERVLLNVGTSLRVGDTQARATAAPSLPPRRVAAGQLVDGMPPPSAVTVTVTHSPVHVPSLGSTACVGGPVMCGSPGGSRSRSSDPASWRQHFKETVAAFDERHNRLQAELSGLKHDALPAGP